MSLSSVWSSIWRAAVVIIAALAAYLGLAAVSMSLVASSVTATIITDLVIAALVLCVMPLVPLRQSAQATHRISRSRRWLWWALSASIVCFFFGQGLTLLLYTQLGSVAYDERAIQLAAQDPIQVLLLSLIVAPVCEEIMLRAGVYRALRRWAVIPVPAAAVLSAVFFAALHGNLVQAVVTVPLGIVLALLVEGTGRIWPAILVHVAFNAAAMFYPADAMTVFAHPIIVGCLGIGFIGVCVTARTLLAVPLRDSGVSISQDSGA